MDRETVIEMILDPASRPVPGSAEQQAFLAYLEQSPECRAMYEQQQAVWEALDLWEPAEPSAGFDRAVYEKIERRPGKFWDLRGWLSWPVEALETLRPGLAAGLAALLLVALSIVTYQPRPGADQVATQQVDVQPAPRIESESVEQIDQALDDIEMLADFDALIIEPQDPGRS
jgi:hypothetical protein